MKTTTTYHHTQPEKRIQAYRENPIDENAIEAAEEIWGIPDPRLMED